MGEPSTDLISLETYNAFVIATVVIAPLISLVGLWNNALNIQAFYRIGLKNSVTVVFFSLAISDFAHLVGAAMFAILHGVYILEANGARLLVPSKLMTSISSNSFRCFAEISYLSTMFLALQRCLCVAKPLHFKDFFTRHRTYAILLTIWLFSVGFAVCLVYYTCIIKTIHDPVTNTSKYVNDFSPARYLVSHIYRTTFFMVLNICNQIVVTGCVLIMANAMYKSALFRNTPANTQTTIENPGYHHGIMAPDVDRNKPYSTIMGAKEKNVIYQVALVCTIFLICNLPRLAMAIGTLLVPDFNLHKRFHLTFLLCFDLMLLFEFMNSSLNFFVYYKYNNTFRKAVWSK